MFNDSIETLRLSFIAMVCGGIVLSSIAFYGASKVYPMDLHKKNDMELLSSK